MVAEARFDYAAATDAERNDVALAAAKSAIRLHPAEAWATRIPKDELAVELANDIWRAATGNTPYDPALSSYATFARNTAYQRMLDKVKSAKRHEEGMESLKAHAAGHDVLQGRRLKWAQDKQRAREEKREKGRDKRFAISGPTFSEEFLECVPAKLNRERGAALSARAYVSAISYKVENDLSWRELWLRMKRDRRLCVLLGFRRCPARSSLHLARARLRAWGKGNQG